MSSIWERGNRFYMFQSGTGKTFAKTYYKKTIKSAETLAELKRNLRLNQLANQKKLVGTPKYAGLSNQARRQALDAHRISAACYAAHDLIPRNTDLKPFVTSPK